MRSISIYVVKDALYGTSEVKENHKRSLYRKLWYKIAMILLPHIIMGGEEGSLGQVLLNL
jgi:hypothetical protein